MTFNELYNEFTTYNREKPNCSPLSAVVVFSASNWAGKIYTEKERSYRFYSNAKYFDGAMCGSSIYADSLDGSDKGIRLDWYIHDWTIEKIYIEEYKK